MVTCWNCDQVVQATAQSCLWCGVAIQPAVTPIVVAPSTAAPEPVSPPAEAQTVPHPSSVPVPAAGYPAPARSGRPEAAPLSAAFAGTAPSVGVQVGAFTIDVFTVVTVAVVVHLTTDSGVLTALALIEALVFLWVLEARAGLTVGHLLLRTRVSRADAPFSPGAGRAFVRQAITHAGLLVGVVGAWVIAASGAWDASGHRRSLAARASGTRAVRPLLKGRAGRSAGARTSYRAAGAPPATAPGTGLAAPRVVSTSNLSHPGEEDSFEDRLTDSVDTAHPHTGPELVTSLDPAAPSQVRGADQAPTATPTIAPVPGTVPRDQSPEQAEAPVVAMTGDHAQVHYSGSAVAADQVPPASVDHPHPGPEPTAAPHASDPYAGEAGSLLLVFDTGQRVTLATSAAINLGRKPGLVEPTDQVVAVEDPEGTVSKFHARLDHIRGQTWVTDQGSTNGTEIVDEDGATHVEPGVPTLVDHGVRVRLGNRSFTVSVLLEPTPSPENPS